jgi:hypothetical protein
MGAWGAGIFQDDTSLDFLADLRGADDPLRTMRTALESAANADYLEYDGACAALVAAAVLDSARSGVALGDVGEDDALDEWVRALDRTRVAAMSGLAATALVRVLSDGCELREMWSENESQFPTWSGAIQALRDRLTAPAGT